MRSRLQAGARALKREGPERAGTSQSHQGCRLPSTQFGRSPPVSIARSYRQNAQAIREGGHKETALPTHNRRQTLTEFRRREFAITETEDNAIAAAAIIGDRRSPVIG